MPYGPFSGEAHSLSNFGTPDSAGMYSNSNGTPVTHMSPSSIKSEPTKLGGRTEAVSPFLWVHHILVIVVFADHIVATQKGKCAVMSSK